MTDTSDLMAPFFRELKNTPFRIASERSVELATAVFGNGGWRLLSIKGAPPKVQAFLSDPPTKTITVSYSGLTMVWCISLYAAFTTDVIKTVRAQADGIINLSAIFALCAPYLDYALLLRQQDLEWPINLPHPDMETRVKALQDTNNVFLGAMSWIILHEVAHIHLNHEDIIPDSLRVRQEYDADEFATCWMLDQTPDDTQREFRILCVGVALAWLMIFEPIGGDAMHPPAHSRLKRVTSCFGASEISYASEVIAHLIKILFFPGEVPPTFDTSRALLDWTLMQLRRLAT